MNIYSIAVASETLDNDETSYEQKYTWYFEVSYITTNHASVK